ncbi:Glutamyl-tRNA(Gln) amidotransferase subunit B, mitochondrial [Teratosphaeria destructans]|uniref:Glutamyl-tRNA(Gln) amidotransferase subunit B, mitochondrial n=1 Tax=Teratosphaeria destructans TaxID=418781 RepID=A0A9W7T227_9PEZI|nr:Glutamyl-tRNA(Gln) amidotransferase subunit B, mitochondrial [Teratosphaeria destructans]
MKFSAFRPYPIHCLSSFASALKSDARASRLCIAPRWRSTRGFSTAAPLPQAAVPLRKHLKDEAKRKKAEHRKSKSLLDPRSEKWELTVGLEIHAELNTACKLFSSAPTEGQDGSPNSRVALFDAALPGTQPQFQVATLLPALRAAIALGCTVQRKSGWDRKHYFHWDQPNGYQITQYYRPFAKDGVISLVGADGVPASDLPPGSESLCIGIKQIQMEQDTAKTTHHPPSTYHVDLNRAGHPLIEIITLPQIHSPQTAAAVVRKIQSILKAVDSCVTGMELGGLRADVNVSVRQRGTDGTGSSYSGVSGLGQRTEIKNLSSFKAVEEAIIAERDRQISVLEAGGIIEGETRGWTLGEKETRRLRGKEGEVDYRYMPDADLPPLLIGDGLVEHLRSSLPPLPEQTVAHLVESFGVSEKDAKTLSELDDGGRVDFLEETVDLMCNAEALERTQAGKTVANWILHEIGGLLAASENITSWADLTITTTELAELLILLGRRRITARAAKQVLATLFDASPDHRPQVASIVDSEGLWLTPLSEAEYEALAQGIMDDNPKMVENVKKDLLRGQKGKAMWFVGQMVRKGEEGTVEPEKAKEVVERLLGVV